LARGESTRQISAALHIDVSTVETYRARIKGETASGRLTRAAAYAIRWHISNARG